MTCLQLTRLTVALLERRSQPVTHLLKGELTLGSQLRLTPHLCE